MSPSLSEVISEVVRPIESRWQVRMGPACAVLFAVLSVSRPVACDLVLLTDVFRFGKHLSVSKSLKRPPAIV